jgi:hypothetical protein
MLKSPHNKVLKNILLKFKTSVDGLNNRLDKLKYENIPKAQNSKMAARGRKQKACLLY